MSNFNYNFCSKAARTLEANLSILRSKHEILSNSSKKHIRKKPLHIFRREKNEKEIDELLKLTRKQKKIKREKLRPSPVFLSGSRDYKFENKAPPVGRYNISYSQIDKKTLTPTMRSTTGRSLSRMNVDSFLTVNDSRKDLNEQIYQRSRSKKSIVPTSKVFHRIRNKSLNNPLTKMMVRQALKYQS